MVYPVWHAGTQSSSFLASQVAPLVLACASTHWYAQKHLRGHLVHVTTTYESRGYARFSCIFCKCSLQGMCTSGTPKTVWCARAVRPKPFCVHL